MSFKLESGESYVNMQYGKDSISQLWLTGNSYIFTYPVNKTKNSAYLFSKSCCETCNLQFEWKQQATWELQSILCHEGKVFRDINGVFMASNLMLKILNGKKNAGSKWAPQQVITHEVRFQEDQLLT